MGKHIVFNVRGRMWRLFRCGRLRKLWGYCDHQKRVIKVSSKVADKLELDTIVHEITHASFPDLSEDVVTMFGTDVAELLWGMGYRRE